MTPTMPDMDMDTSQSSATPQAPPVPPAVPAPNPDPASYDPLPYKPSEAPTPPAYAKPPSSDDGSPDPSQRDLRFGGGTKGAIGSIATMADSILRGFMKGRERSQQQEIAKATNMVNAAKYGEEVSGNKMLSLAQQPDIAPILTKMYTNPKYQPTPEETKTIQPYMEARNNTNNLFSIGYQMQGKLLFGEDKKGKGKGKGKGGGGDGDADNLMALAASKDPNDKARAAYMIVGKSGSQWDAKVKQAISQSATAAKSAQDPGKLISDMQAEKIQLEAKPNPTNEDGAKITDLDNRIRGAQAEMSPPKPVTEKPTSKPFQRDGKWYQSEVDPAGNLSEKPMPEGYAPPPITPKPQSKDDRYIDITSRYSRDPKSITPDEASFVSAYDQWVKKTKTEPGVARMAALANTRYTPVVDPSDPSGQNVILEHAADAAKSHASLPASAGFQSEKKVLQSATSGKLGETLNYFNTATSHLKLLNVAADALRNGDMQAVNRMAQSFAAATGSAAPTNFDAIKTAVTGEVAKTFQGGRATQGEMKSLEEVINRAQSPEQLTGAIGAFTSLLNSKREAVQQQIKSGLQGKPNFGEESGNKPKHSLKKAMSLPFNKGKSEADVRKDLESHNYEVTP